MIARHEADPNGWELAVAEAAQAGDDFYAAARGSLEVGGKPLPPLKE
ncbi:hypothetical protein [Paractinoplanes hotanensis]|uniref:Uncharacterized protein n=1 Tax=Paractinoplanes hotanensis TaxID=2906497 RepID=A0ABT0YBV9_9ACTN|nr:hypothetical protein [Actinoplanes hotanensis]MCM4083531.1 hypothetical protein [Actinoplanes hotanensis]